MKLPIVYHQIKKIRAVWLRSTNPAKDEMIAELDNTLREIERDHLIDLEISEGLEYINE